MRLFAIFLCLELAAAHPQPHELPGNPEDPDIDHMLALLGEGSLGEESSLESSASTAAQMTHIETSESSYFISTGGDKIKEITVAEANDYGLTCMPAGALSQSADSIIQESVEESAAVAASASGGAATSSAAAEGAATSASASSVGVASSAAAGGDAASSSSVADDSASSSAASGEAVSSSAAAGEAASSSAAAGDAASSSAAAAGDAASSSAAAGDAASSSAAAGEAASSSAAAGEAASSSAAAGDAASSSAASGDAASSSAAAGDAASSSAAAGEAASSAAAAGDTASSAAAGDTATSSAANGGTVSSSAASSASESSSSSAQIELEDGEEGYLSSEEIEAVGECVPYYLCKDGDIIADGAGLIDMRFGDDDEESKSNSQCPNFLDVFCRVPLSDTDPDILEDLTEYEYEPSCGHRNPEGISIILDGFKEGESQFGEFPWMGIVLEDELLDYDQIIQRYVCGASLIHPQVIMTGAHCVNGKDATKLSVRLGDWDTQNEKEIFPHEQHRVASMEIHERFNGANLRYDVALLFLEAPVVLQQHIDTICLPAYNENFDYTSCVATGYGKDQFHGGRFQNIMKQVDLPVVPHRTCNNRLRETRLGRWFRLHRTFTCAGGEAGVDTCRGDGGSPLACPSKEDPNKYVQVGIVAWGIGCGENGVPGVYASVPKLVNWVHQKMADHGFGLKEPSSVNRAYKAAPPV